MAKQCTSIAVLTLAALLAAGAVSGKPAKKKTRPKPAVITQAPAAATAPTVVPIDPNVADLPAVSGMAAAGAPGLALKLMDRDQPDFTADPVGWMSWERERIFIYQASLAWKEIIARAGKLPAGVGTDFRAWEEMQAADAWLHQGDGGKARALLQPILWSGDAPPAGAELADLRRLLIRSYIADKRLDDAQTAVIRYRQDYPKDAGDWPILEARLYLKLGEPDQALDVLQTVSGPEANLLALLASLRAGEIMPADAFKQAAGIGNDAKAPIPHRVHAWAVAAEAEEDLKDPAARIKAMQNALGLESGLLDGDDVFTLTPDMLWDAYLAYGHDLGNQLQLVVGDDQAWFVAASNRYDSAPVDAAALFSVVAYEAADPKQAAVAQGQFAALIQKQAMGSVLLRRLYLDSSRLKGVEDIDASVRYLLVDDVLEIPDIPLASLLMQGLDAPPDNVSSSDWQLKRAHVFILGGDPDAGVASLKQLLAHYPAPPASTAPAPASAAAPAAQAPSPAPAVDADEVLQALFDLQTLHRDKDAIPFFETLLKGPLAPEQRRQMLYWMADSYKALGDYAKAAELYMRSAMLLDPFSMDQWAQTARYQGAQMLAKAGYIEDARNVYRGLLNATRDPAQQAVLQHDLQQLMLMPAKSDSKKH
ncbi:MAG: hypothetical protein ACM3ZT_04270 [Bacillota bacterium]